MEVGPVTNSRKVLVQRLVPKRSEIQNFRFSGVATGGIATPEPAQIQGSFSARSAPSMRIAAESGAAGPVSFSVQGETLTFTATVDLSSDTTINAETEAGITPLLKVSAEPEGLTQLIRACWLAFDTPGFIDAIRALRVAINDNWDLLDLPDEPLVVPCEDERLAGFPDIQPSAFANTRAWLQTREGLRDFNRSCVAHRTSFIVGPYSGERIESVYSYIIEGPGRGVMHLFSDRGKPVFSLQSLEPNGAIHLPLENLTVVLNSRGYKTTKASLQRSLALYLRRVVLGKMKKPPTRDKLFIVNLEVSPYHFLYDHFYGMFGTIGAAQGNYTYACLDNAEYLEVDDIVGPPARKVYYSGRRQLGRFLSAENGVVIGLSERLDQTEDPQGYLDYINAIQRANLPVLPEFEASLEGMRAMDGIAWFGISGPGQKRLWENQVECIVAMIAELDEQAARAGLRIGVVIDGWTNSVQQRGMPSPSVQSDMTVFQDIVQALGGRPDVWSLIGFSGHEKMQVARLTFAAVVNAGTGAAFVSKLMRRPVLLRDNPYMMLNNAKTWDVTSAERIDASLVSCAALDGMRQDMVDFTIDRDGMRTAFATYLAKHLSTLTTARTKDDAR